MKIHNYTKDEIRSWLENQTGTLPISLEEEHVADGLYDISKWYWEDKPLPDDFYYFVLKNDLKNSVGYADNTNRRFLYLYALFLYNCLPLDYKDKLRKDFQE